MKCATFFFLVSFGLSARPALPACEQSDRVFFPSVAEDAHIKLVRDANGDFDRFLNSVFFSSDPDAKIFEKTSDIGRAFDPWCVSNGMRTMKFAPGNRALTPFDDFANYMRDTKPRMVIDPWLRSIDQSPRPNLAKSDRVVIKKLDRSILLCQGEANIQTSTDSIVVVGGDVAIRGAGSSMIFAAGDVTLAAGSRNSLVIAGGKVRIAGTILGDLFIVTPKKLEVDHKSLIERRKIILYEGKQKPAPDLFHFPELADYGLKAVRDEGKVKIQIIKVDSPFQKILKERDIVLAAKKTKIESVAHFRRLVSHAVDTGRLELEVERDGKSLTIKADLK